MKSKRSYMKQFKLSYLFLIAVAVLFGGCKLERLPETQFSDANYWHRYRYRSNCAGLDLQLSIFKV